MLQRDKEIRPKGLGTEGLLSSLVGEGVGKKVWDQTITMSADLACAPH